MVTWPRPGQALELMQRQCGNDTLQLSHLGHCRQHPLLLQLLLQLTVLVDLSSVQSELLLLLPSFVIASGFGSSKPFERQAFWVLATFCTAVFRDLAGHFAR